METKLLNILKKIKYSTLPPLVAIAGNGVNPVNNIKYPLIVVSKLRRSSIYKKATASEKKDLEKWNIWKFNEYVRIMTWNYRPSAAQFFLYWLASKKYLTTIITTNYDMSFDALFAKMGRFKFQMNPILTSGEYHWDGYYSKPDKKIRVKYWKIHGSLGHVVFDDCKLLPEPHIFKLPPFLISPIIADLITHFKLDITHAHLGYLVNEYDKTYFSDDAGKSSFSSYTDWTYENNRKAFRREIAGAIRTIDKNKSSPIILAGFSAYFNSKNPNDPYNEELAEYLLDQIAHRNLDPNNIFMLITNQQKTTKLVLKPETGELARILAKRGNLASADEIDEWIIPFVSKHLSKSPIIGNDFDEFKNDFTLLTLKQVGPFLPMGSFKL